MESFDLDLTSIDGILRAYLNLVRDPAHSRSMILECILSNLPTEGDFIRSNVELALTMTTQHPETGRFIASFRDSLKSLAVGSVAAQAG